MTAVSCLHTAGVYLWNKHQEKPPALAKDNDHKLAGIIDLTFLILCSSATNLDSNKFEVLMLRLIARQILPVN
jgi:hypothetical protein